MSLNTQELARTLTDARKNALAFSNYPAEIPKDLEASYKVQDAAIVLWQDAIIGWKIGRLSPEAQQIHNTERLTGPIFKNRFWRVADFEKGAKIQISMINGGFAAVEAEFVFEVGKDAPNDKYEYTQSEALELVSHMYAGVEIAGSPINDINSYGPLVVASDFGNNNGLILGDLIIEPKNISDLDESSVKKFKAATEVNGKIVGEGGLFSMPNGPLAAIAWLAGHLASRDHPLKKGQYISSGASTGIHDVYITDKSIVRFTDGVREFAPFEIEMTEAKIA